jgi:DNA invertase Pin-like site-specific DNA recombinase
VGRQRLHRHPKFDRFARNMAEANDILTDLRGRGVQFGLGASVYD